MVLACPGASLQLSLPWYHRPIINGRHRGFPTPSPGPTVMEPPPEMRQSGLTGKQEKQSHSVGQSVDKTKCLSGFDPYKEKFSSITIRMVS